MTDLCSTFFSMPVHPDDQYLFAFTWNEWQYTWTIMPQGYTESPTYVSHILKADLDDLDFPHKSVLIQYVDDLPLCSNCLKNSQQDTKYLFQKLVLKGHRVSKEKLQFCMTSGKYLGHRIFIGGLFKKYIQHILISHPFYTY